MHAREVRRKKRIAMGLNPDSEDEEEKKEKEEKAEKLRLAKLKANFFPKK